MTDKLNFNGIYGMMANPLQQVFIMGSIWFLTRQKRNQYLNIFEIGSWIGASALTWVEALRIHNSRKGALSCIDARKPYYNQNEICDDLIGKINEA